MKYAKMPEPPHIGNGFGLKTRELLGESFQLWFPVTRAFKGIKSGSATKKIMIK